MPKKAFAMLLVVLVLSLVGGAGVTRGQTPAVTPTPPATAAPIAAMPADDWARIQQKGRMFVGTSADNSPFSYYNANFAIDGFDAAVIRAIAQEMGIKVDMRDLAFPSLIDALQINQIDAAIGALTVMPERAEQVDFSNTYYVSTDAVLAPAGAPVPKVTKAQDLAHQIVGVQTGSIYAEWAQKNLVDAGILAAEDVVTFDDLAKAQQALTGGEIDRLLLDYLPAETFVEQGNVQKIGEGLIGKQQYAIAVRKGSTLLGPINDALTALQDQGKIVDLAQQYLNLDQPLPVPTPLPTPLPTPTATPTRRPVGPTPTPPPVTCIDGSMWVADLTYDDSHSIPVLKPGQRFVKTWRIGNTGTCTWTNAYLLAPVSGDLMGGSATSINGPVKAGRTYDVSVNLVAPRQPGVYKGTWQMVSGRGAPFGERIWVQIQVPSDKPTPTPTPTPPLVGDMPFITQFSAMPSQVTAGDQVIISWQVLGNVAYVQLYKDGTRFCMAGGCNFSAQSSQVDYPAVGSHTYQLVAYNPAGRTVSSDLARVVVYSGVSPTPTPTPPVVGDMPFITQFGVEPNWVNPGDPVYITWEVMGNVSYVQIYEDGGRLCIAGRCNYDATGSQADYPSEGTHTYQVIAFNPDGRSVSSDPASITVYSIATPTPTEPVIGDMPFITRFDVDPSVVDQGNPVSLAWNVEGNVDRVEIRKDGGQFCMPGGCSWGPSGGASDYPDVGAHTYQLIAYSPQGRAVTSDPVTINVEPLVGPVTPPEEPTFMPEPTS